VLRKSLRYILSPFIAKKFRNSVRNIDDINDALDFAFSFQAFEVSIKPAQVEYEIAKLLEIVAELKPKVVLEIGTAGGGTLFLFTRVVDSEAKIISIDLPGGSFGGGYPRWKIPLYKSFSKEGQEIYLIRRDSHDPQTLEEVKRILGGEKVDSLFIDGDHAYEGVKKDFEMYSPLVRNGGIIAFHDIVPGLHECVGGVPKFWREVKSNYISREIVKDWNQGGFGIGVIYV
jgi:cephalosporin hydroxylase